MCGAFRAVRDTRAEVYPRSMIFSENRFPTPDHVRGMLFGIMLCPEPSCDILRKGKRIAMQSLNAARRQAAESLAIQALTFLAGEPERLGRFLTLTGIGPAQIRAAAASPGFLAGVLDHLASDDALVIAFAAEAGIEPSEIEQARRVLSDQ